VEAMGVAGSSTQTLKRHSLFSKGNPHDAASDQHFTPRYNFLSPQISMVTHANILSESCSLQINPVPIYRPPPLDPTLQQAVLPTILEHRNLQELNMLDPFEFPVSYYIP
jgi:hypothetical protein